MTLCPCRNIAAVAKCPFDLAQGRLFGAKQPRLRMTSVRVNQASGGFLAWEFGFLVAVFGGGVFYGGVDLSAD